MQERDSILKRANSFRSALCFCFQFALYFECKFICVNLDTFLSPSYQSVSVREGTRLGQESMIKVVR